MNTQRWEHERRGPKGKMNKTTGVSAFLKLQPVGTKKNKKLHHLYAPAGRPPEQVGITVVQRRIPAAYTAIFLIHFICDLLYPHVFAMLKNTVFQ